MLAWLQARAAGIPFVMRVEDLDPGRSRAEHEVRMLEDLRWLELDWDEGPDVGGPNGPYRQSERGDIYMAALERLETFECTCTRRELREATLAPHGAEPIYPGTCRDGPSHPERPRASRWVTPTGVVEVEDQICGKLVQGVRDEVGDFVLRRNDGAWAYQLAVVVDDAAMGITDVVRGADLVESTPRQVLLQRSLDLPTPRYAHVPLVLGPDGAKLAKRHGAPDLSALREGGANPRRVIAALARSLGLIPPEVDALAPAALVDEFRLSFVSAEPTVLDPAWLGDLTA